MDPEILDALRRRSGVGVTRDGVFSLNGRPVENARVQTLFARGLRVRDDGDVVLEVGDQWCYVTCETVARFVDGLRVEAARLVARFSDGTERALDRATVGYGPDDRFYVWEDDAAAPAVLRRSAHQTLVGLMDPDGAVAVPDGSLPVMPLAAVPTASERRPDRAVPAAEGS